MELFLLLIQVPLLIYLIKYIRKRHSNPLLVNSYYYLLSFKITAGFLLGILYSTYYSGSDTFRYLSYNDYLSELFYNDIGKYINHLLFKESIPPVIHREIYFQSRAFIFIRITSPIFILTGSNYWMLSIYLSMFSFSGLWILSNTLIKLYKLNAFAVMISFFIFPSIVFWSSGVLKESLAIGLMTYIINIVLLFVHKKQKIPVLSFVVLGVFSYILLMMKFYYFAPLMAILLPYGIIKYFSINTNLIVKKKRYRFVALFFFVFLFGGVVSLMNPYLNLKTLSKELYTNYNETKSRSTDSSTYTFEGLNEEPVSFIRHLPKALSYGLFGPYLWHCKKIITLISGVENTILLTLFVVFLLSNLKKEKLLQIDIEVVSVVLYVFITATIIAFASPNWGP